MASEKEALELVGSRMGSDDYEAGINSQVVIIGQPEAGKTALLKEIVSEHVRAGAMTFVMDVNKQFSKVVPWFESVAHYAAANRLMQQAGHMYSSAAIGSKDSEALTRFVMDLAKALKKAPSPKPRHIALCYDESDLIDGMMATYIPPMMSELMTQRRHLNVGISLLTQDPGLIQQRWITGATDIFMFQTLAEERIKRVAKLKGMEFEALRKRLARLPERYRFIRIRHSKIVGSKLGDIAT